MTQITTTYIDHMGSDLSVVNAARVSFGKKAEWEYHDSQTMRLADRDTKLINYLAKHKHISPFGHAFASFHIKAPIFVARQLVKHKFLRWNEISRRYVDDEPEFYVPEVWRGRSADKKQGSEGEVKLGTLDDVIVSESPFEALCAYSVLLDAGVAPEQARMVLPQSTMTEWYWSGSLDAFADMCRLRCKEDTQYESRLVADQVSTIMQDLYPVSWAALMEGETE
ncbi:thymidylate synthase [Lentibacter phage vB_LenP_ICBM1]|uniref:Thymidylate synthase n=2 Tax=Siovirus germanense TaxID=2845497 RepID=A0A3G2YRD9_9CAUD|nr:thymidylate synthase [Lentibacter phage vB_LenP_ICBM1]AYP28051.1 putative thymidylate synthase [Lentibacter phage vB_LenP_ICBM3]AYP28125.1 thymidylate synthase [Lentibacter phage vB_LenP_ICBM1]